MGKLRPSPSDCLHMGMSCACFGLRRAARAVTQLFDSYFDEVGLKATQYTVLAALAQGAKHKPTVTELAETLVLDQSSLSRNLAVLERQGFVRLQPGADRRERIVSLTRTGDAAVARGFPIWKRAQAAISSTIEPSVLDGHLRLLRHLTRAALDQNAARTGTASVPSAKARPKSAKRAASSASVSVPAREASSRSTRSANRRKKKATASVALPTRSRRG